MRRLRERTQYLRIKRKSYRLLKDFAGILSEEPKSAKLKKKKNRGEKGFKISADFTGVFDNILLIFLIIIPDINSSISISCIFCNSRSPIARSLSSIRRRYR
jgi:hypothetical protein